MFGIILAIVLACVLYGIVRPSVFGEQTTPLRRLMLGAYGARLALATFVVRDIAFFSHGLGGDSFAYEAYADIIARYWEHSGVHFMTSADMPAIGAASLPPNLFATIIYVNGGLTLIGCTSVIAFVACLTCLNIYALATDLGSDPKVSFRIAAVTLFAPGFLMYTSDTYKDGLVLFLVVGAVTSAIRLSRKLSIVHLVFGVLCLYALWFVRHYLVFAALGPLLVGLGGTRSKSRIRPVAVAAVLGLLLIAIASYTTLFSEFGSQAQASFEQGTGESSRAWNAEIGASGVTFDDGGSPYGALGPKVLYTLFSPFPWQSGSLGFNIGKLDVALWYFFFYFAIRAAFRLWADERSLVLMILVFIIPTTFVYSLSMANIGLILRQRMPIVMLGTLLANLYWRKKAAADESPANVRSSSSSRLVTAAGFAKP